MSMIHQKLYQGTNLSTIEMKEYFQNLGSHVLDSFGIEDRILIEYDMQKTELDIDTAVPLGLIVNELFTNALKYAFIENQEGKIRIEMYFPSKDMLHLSVEDNGIGQKEIGEVKGTGFGSQLVQLLCQQLNGKMNQQSDFGTKVNFDFPVHK